MNKLEQIINSLTLEEQIVMCKLLTDKDKDNKQMLRDKCALESINKLGCEGYTISVNKDSITPGSKILNQEYVQAFYPDVIMKCTKTVVTTDWDAVEMAPEILKDEKAITTTPDSIRKGSVVVKCEK